MHRITYENKVLVSNIPTKKEAMLISKGIKVGIDLMLDSLRVVVPKSIDNRIVSFSDNIITQKIDWFNLKAS